jgi:hypothetical protein
MTMRFGAITSKRSDRRLTTSGRIQVLTSDPLSSPSSQPTQRDQVSVSPKLMPQNSRPANANASEANRESRRRSGIKKRAIRDRFVVCR